MILKKIFDRIFKLIIVLKNSKIVFKEPGSKKIVLFDRENFYEFNNILKKKDYFLLENRFDQIKKVYFFPKLIFLLIKHYNGNLITTYFITLIKIINPKVVLTYTDNCFKFSDIAKALEGKIKFIAVQNAFRLDLIEHNYLYKQKYHKYNLNYKLNIPYLFCLGQFDKIIHKKFKIKVKKMYKLGSLRMANAFKFFKQKKINVKTKEFDICLIEDLTWSAHFVKEKNNDISESKYIATGYIDLIKFTINFCKKNKKKLIFLTRIKEFNSNSFWANLKFYKDNLSKDDYNYLVKSIDKNYLKPYYQYLSCFKSKVSISMFNTLLGENLSSGNKILACNFSKMKLLDFPINSICRISNCSYYIFEKRLKLILSMSNKKYFSIIGNKRYFLSFLNKKSDLINTLKTKIYNFAN